MRRHEKDAARSLANLNKDLVTDLSQMSPEAAAYLRKREAWFSEDLMRKWGVGWIPGNGRSLFRKHYIVYTHRNTRGDVVSYSGRDVNFETKWEKWIRAGKPEGKKPNKHRYVSGFHRGAELYGGHASRLEEPHVKESLEKNGLVVVEGMNDVIRLDELGVCAVGVCSNKATEQQIEMISRFARVVANNRVMLFPDTDREGTSGFKDLLWNLSKLNLVTSLAIEDGEEPEDVSSFGE
jgi:DNA primase